MDDAKAHIDEKIIAQYNRTKRGQIENIEATEEKPSVETFKMEKIWHEEEYYQKVPADYLAWRIKIVGLLVKRTTQVEITYDTTIEWGDYHY